MKAPSLFLIALASSAAFGAPLTPDSRLTHATVYADQAVITRTARIDLPTVGLVEIALEKLPAELVDASLQATGRGSAGATLLEVSTRPTFVAFAANERVKALEDQLRGLSQDDRRLADRATVLTQQRDYVLRIQNATTTPAKDGANITTAPDVWTRMLAFSAEQLGQLATEVQGIDLEREQLQARRQALEQQLNELRGSRDRSYKTATIRLDVATPGTLDLTLRYAVPGASWSPAYDVRARSSDRTVKLGYAGLVRQNTGEDWTNVDLTLSTARPSLGGKAPELQPWIVQQQELQALYRAVAQSGPATLSKARMANEAFADSVAEIGQQLATVSSQATSATFHIAAPASVPSDNAPHKIPVTTLSLDGELSYESTPKLLPAAFLTAKVANTSEFPLLAGAMNVFLDDTFVATAPLSTAMPGEKFDLALGADEGVSVKRKLNNRFVEDTGIVSRGRRITYDITLTVQNNKSLPVKLTLRDQIPVSRHEKIVVKVTAPPERELRPDAEGVLSWTLDLKPGEKRELALKFSVEHPNDLPVSGLE